MNLEIVEPNNSQALEIQNFMLDIIKNDFGYDFNSDWHWDIERLIDTYINNSKNCIYIATQGNEILGTITARSYDKDYEIFKDKYNSENTIGIWRHYVRSDSRGKGIGTKLLSKVEDFAIKNKYKYIYLHTQKTIKGSLEYWLAKGYQITYDLNDSLQTVHLEKSIY